MTAYRYVITSNSALHKSICFCHVRHWSRTCTTDSEIILTSRSKCTLYPSPGFYHLSLVFFTMFSSTTVVLISSKIAFKVFKLQLCTWNINASSKQYSLSICAYEQNKCLQRDVLHIKQKSIRLSSVLQHALVLYVIRQISSHNRPCDSL